MALTTGKSGNAVQRFLAGAATTLARAVSGGQTMSYSRVLLSRSGFKPESDLAYETAYSISPYVYTCVNLIAEAAATLDLELYAETNGQKRKVDDDKPGSAGWLLDQPGPRQSAFDLIEATVANLMVFGNAWILKDRMGATADSKDRTPMELTVMPSALVRAVPGPNRTIARVEYFNDGNWIPYAPEDVIHIPLWGPTNQIEGLSPLSAAMLGVRTKRNADLLADAVVQTGGGMPGIFSVKETIGAEQEKAFLERLRAKWRGGFRRLLEPDFFPGDVSFSPTANTLAEMQFVEINKMSGGQIALIYRVPPIFVGVKEGGGLSDAGAKTDLLLFWEHRMRPLLRRIERALDRQLLVEWAPRSSGTRLTCSFDLAKVLALTEAHLEQAKAMTEITKGPIWLPNEAREKLGDEPLDDSDLEKLNARARQGVSPAPSSTGVPAPAVVPQATPAGPARPKRKPVSASSRLTREALHDAAELQTERAEALATRLYGGIVNEQEERCLDALQALPIGANRRVVIPEVEAVLAAITHDHDRLEVRTFLERLVEATGQGAVDVIPRGLVGRALAFDMQARDVRRWLKENIDAAIDVPNDTTRRLLRMSLADGWQSGEGMTELSRRVQDVFSVRRANTATIARTEVVSALNFAAAEGYAQTGVVAELEWATARDEQVRGLKPRDEWDHAVMNGRRVRLGELWMVPRHNRPGSEALRQPGDSKASAANRINCRCRVLPVIGRAPAAARGPGAFWSRTVLEEHRHSFAEVVGCR